MTDHTLSFPAPFANGTCVGVAVEVPAPWVEALRQLRENAENRPSQEIIAPHITLLPPTELPTFDLAPVERELERAAAEIAPFEVELCGSGTFRPTTQVVYAALARGGSECEALQRSIRQGPLSQELRFTYHAHVTVAQDVPPERLDAAEQALSQFRAVFPVREFVFYELGPEGRWHTLRRYRLHGRA